MKSDLLINSFFVAFILQALYYLFAGITTIQPITGSLREVYYSSFFIVNILVSLFLIYSLTKLYADTHPHRWISYSLIGILVGELYMRVVGIYEFLTISLPEHIIAFEIMLGIDNLLRVLAPILLFATIWLLYKIYRKKGTGRIQLASWETAIEHIFTKTGLLFFIIFTVLNYSLWVFNALGLSLFFIILLPIKAWFLLAYVKHYQKKHSIPKGDSFSGNIFNTFSVLGKTIIQLIPSVLLIAYVYFGLLGLTAPRGQTLGVVVLIGIVGIIALIIALKSLQTSMLQGLTEIFRTHPAKLLIITVTPFIFVPIANTMAVGYAGIIHDILFLSSTDIQYYFQTVIRTMAITVYELFLLALSVDYLNIEL